MSAVSCPRCQHNHFEVTVIVSCSDFDVEAVDRFELDRKILDTPDDVDVEAVCRNCGHARYVDDHQWEWA